MGWIFFKPKYERMELVDREDLDSDPGKVVPSCGDYVAQDGYAAVVRFQHKHYGISSGQVLSQLLIIIHFPSPVGSFLRVRLAHIDWNTLG